MWSYVFFGIFSALLCFTSGLSATKLFRKTAEEDCGKSSSVKSRMQGGQETERGDYPWMVSVQTGSGEEFSHKCGGSIIDENWIITAAHCVNASEPPQNYRAVVGLLKKSQSEDEGVEHMKISKIVVHEEFVGKENGFKDDIALMKTEEPIDFEGNEYVGTICLPDSDEDPSGNAFLAGWGAMPEEEDSPDTLLDAKIPIIPREKCKEDGTNLAETQICAGGENTHACPGDSGGPLMELDESGQTSTLIGIVSNVPGSGCTEGPGVYTKVASYVDWINEKKSE